MVRTYKPKRRQWRDKDKRMGAAVKLRAQGYSLRRIATALAVDEKTVRNDLKRSAERQAASAPNVIPLVRNSAADSRPAGGNFPHPDSAPEPIPLTRRN